MNLYALFRNALTICIVYLLVGVSFFAPTEVQAQSDVAVVLVDMQSGFLEPWQEFPPKLVSTQLELLSWAKANNVPILIFQFIGEGSTIYSLRKAIAESTSSQFVWKSNDGGFLNNHSRPDLILKNWGIRKIIIAGVNGPYCVRCTAEEATREGFQVLSSADIVADYQYQ